MYYTFIINEEQKEKLNNGISPFMDSTLEELSIINSLLSNNEIQVIFKEIRGYLLWIYRNSYDKFKKEFIHDIILNEECEIKVYKLNYDINQSVNHTIREMIYELIYFNKNNGISDRDEYFEFIDTINQRINEFIEDLYEYHVQEFIEELKSLNIEIQLDE